MITSINGLSNTPIQDNTIHKENVAKEGKQDKSVIEEKFDYSKYMFRPWTDNVKEFIDIDQSKEGWITDTINRIDNMLSDYPMKERRALASKYPPETMEEFRVGELQSYMDWLLTNSVDGKPTIIGFMIGLGTAEEEAELEAFVKSFPEGTMMSNDGAALFVRADLSIEEFKKLYLNFKEKRGIDVLELMQKIDKKQILNKMA